jgi:F-type H+-transporting ATPase subunit delta
MADRTTIARPYAKAAFEEARAAKQLTAWSGSLRTAAAVVQDERVQQLLGNPLITPAELARLVIEIAGGQLDDTGRNFIRTLAENHRLSYLPEIAALFDELKDEAEGVVNVTVTSAAPLDAGQRERLALALQRRLHRQVRMSCIIDPTLIGGALLRAGDLVIDGSLRTRLDRIAYELTT